MKYCFRYSLYLAVTVWFSVAHAGSYEDFFIAINRGDDRAVAQLLERGFDPNSRDPKGQTGLILAMCERRSRTAAS